MNDKISNTFPVNCVSLISKNLIYLENVSQNVIKALKVMNAESSELENRTIWKVAFSNRVELIEKLKELNQLGFIFAGGPHGWPPAAVVADLHDKKLLTGNFKEVRWRGPDDWFIIER